ncbi:hypothetical protein [Desulforamulus aeronauticus]|uniref:Histidine kinase n=1 Tax=Desulforamulus aeronauticus DSM 10349 TaxID=1121421 RepID=A0A1M6TMU3_9FIRM|nr:hypothetical protein [Desulforamulus aeronauticus]SHK58271.1 hypothetical protein SAMN02745123_02385 [Desulforamulus aeronauticus DSM 10349]
MTSTKDKAVIHALNNLITVIQGNAELIQLKQGLEEAREILEACRKMQGLLNSLRQER